MEGIGQSAVPSIRDLLDGAFRDRRRILAAGGVVMALAVVLALVIPAKYVASSSLLVLLGPEYTVRPQAGTPAAATNTFDRDQILKSEIEILGSPALHEATMRRVGLASIYPDYLDPPGLLARVKAWAAAQLRDAEAAVGITVKPPVTPDPVQVALREFDRNLDVLAVKDGSVLELEFRHPDADTAATVLNTLMAEYLQRRRALYEDLQSGAVERQVAGLRTELDAANARLAAFKAAHDISNYETERDLLLQQRNGLQGDLHSAEMAVAQSRARLGALTTELAASPATITEYADHDSDARAATLRAGIEELQAKQADLAAHYLPDSRPMQEAAAGIALRQQELRRLRAETDASATRIGRNPVHDGIDLDRVRSAAELQASLAQRDAAAGAVATLDATLRTLDADEVELQKLTRAASLAEDALHDLTRVLAERRVVEQIDAMRAANVRIVQPAEVPVRPRSLTLPILLAGTLLAGMAAAAAAVLGEALRNHIASAASLERTLGVPVLAVLPETDLLRS